MSALDKNRRKHDDLRAMVEKACKGVMPHIDTRIKDAARRAYYLGCRDGIEVERTSTSELATKTIANHKEMVNAHTRIQRRKAGSKSQEKRLKVQIAEPTEVEKQKDYVEASLDRCRRCGDHTYSILPTQPLSLLCGDCERTVKATDGGVMWFAQLVAAVEEKTNGNDSDSTDVAPRVGDQR
jgi:hypothetical protein